MPTKHFSDSFTQKIEALEKRFQDCATVQEKYELLMKLGQTLPALAQDKRVEENRVYGCQSTMYLHAELSHGKILFSAYSDALISSGLAALFIQIYNDENPSVLIDCPPNFLENLGIHASLSPNRAHGMLRIYLKMKELAQRHVNTATNSSASSPMDHSRSS